VQSPSAVYPNCSYISGIKLPYTCAARHQIVSLLPIFMLYASEIYHCPYGQVIRLFFQQLHAALIYLETCTIFLRGSIHCFWPSV